MRTSLSPVPVRGRWLGQITQMDVPPPPPDVVQLPPSPHPVPPPPAVPDEVNDPMPGHEAPRNPPPPPSGRATDSESESAKIETFVPRLRPWVSGNTRHLLAATLRHALPRPLVFTYGVFDLLHAGHVAYLAQARRLGASLVVGVHSDAAARRMGMGSGRPCNPEQDRTRVVSALSSVSATLLFDEERPLALMVTLRPDICVQVGEHDNQRMVEADLLSEWGAVAVLVPRRRHLTAGALVERLPRSASATWSA